MLLDAKHKGKKINKAKVSVLKQSLVSPIVAVVLSDNFTRLYFWKVLEYRFRRHNIGSSAEQQSYFHPKQTILI